MNETRENERIPWYLLLKADIVGSICIVREEK